MSNDFRIMNKKMGSGICLSELKLGFHLYDPYMLVCRAKLRPEVCTKMSMAVSVTSAEEALDWGLVDEFYDGDDDLTRKIMAFAKRYAAQGLHRNAIKTNKNMQYQDTIDVCNNFRWTPAGLAGVKQDHVGVVKFVK